MLKTGFKLSKIPHMNRNKDTWVIAKLIFIGPFDSLISISNRGMQSMMRLGTIRSIGHYQLIVSDQRSLKQPAEQRL